jgi:hypothetical protein
MDEELKKEVVKNFSKASDMVMDPIKQRMSHPLASSFVLSWILFNWRPIFYFILAPDSIKEKIAFISVNFYSNGLWNLLYYLVVPLGLSLIYIGLFDRISNKINRFKEQDILDKYEHEKKIGVEKYNSQREIMVARRALNNVTSDNHTIEQLNLQIEALKSENAKKDEHLTTAQQELEKRAEALLNITEQRDSIETKLFDIQEEYVSKIRASNDQIVEKDLQIVNKDDEIIQLREELDKAKQSYDDLKLKDQELSNKSQELMDLKNNTQNLLKKMFGTVERDIFLQIVSGITSEGLSKILRELTEEEYKMKNGRSIQKYRRVFNNPTYVDYPLLRRELMKIDQRILAYELHENGREVLEIAYPHQIPLTQIVDTVDRFLLMKT